MRNLKKLLAVIVSLCVIATFTVPAFAEDSFSYESEAQVLNDLGLYAGIATDGTFDADLGTALNRETGVVLLERLFGLQADALAMTDAEVEAALADYTDADAIGSWAEKQMAYAIQEGLVVGMTETTVGPKVAMSGKMYCTLILRQLGFSPIYNEAPAQLADVGGLTTLQAIEYMNKALLKDDLVGISYGTLNASYADGATVIEKLVEDGIVSDEAALAAGFTAQSSKALAEAAAEAAVAAFEVAPITTLVEVTAAEALGATADTAVAAVTDTAKNAAFVARVTAKDALVAPAKVTLTPLAATATQLNYMEVRVDFSKAATGVGTAANYTIGGVTPASATAAADNKSVVLKKPAYVAGAQANVAIVCKTALGFAADTTVTAAGIADSTVPTVTGVTVSGPNQLTVSFSEPITSESITATTNFSLDNNVISVNTVTGAAGDSSLVLATGALSTGSHTLKINPNGTLSLNELKDFAGLYVRTTSQTFTYTADATAPTVSFTSASQNQVVVTFSKAITQNTALVRAYHTYANDSYISGEPAWSNGGTTATFTFTTFLPAGNVTIFINNTVAGTPLKDGWSNAFVNATLTGTAVIDTTAPTATAAFVNATSIDVTYSEAVTTTATTISNYTLKNSAGTAIAISGITASGNVYRLTTAQMTGGAYTLAIANIKDNAPSANTIAAVTLAITATDAIAPTVTDASKYSSDRKTVVISFSEAMAVSGANSILDLNSYVYYDGGVLTAWPTGTTIAAGTGNTSVIITMTSLFSYLTPGDTVVVGRVADAVGNKTAALSTVTTLAADALATGNIAVVKAISTTSVTFEVNTPLSAIDITKFTRVGVGVGTAVSNVSYVNQAVTGGVNGSLVTVTTATAWATDAAPTVTLLDGAITSSLGTALANGGGTMTTAGAADVMAPAITSISTMDVGTGAVANGKIDRIDVLYSEALTVSTVSDTDYTVAGYTITGVLLSGNTARLTVTEVGYDTSATPVVTQVGAVSDAVGNVLAAGATKATVDTAAPVLLDAVITNAGATAGYGNNVGDVIQLIFSEAITLKAGYVAADLENDFLLTTDTGAGFTADAIAAAGNAITITAAGAASTDVTVVGNRINKSAVGPYVLGDILDAAGNNLGFTGLAGVESPNGVAVR